MIFKMYNCDFGFKYNGVNYDFEHVESVSVEDPESTKLIRGSNQSNKVGLVYTEGTKDPKAVTVTVLGLSSALHGLLKTIYDTKARCEFYCIDRTDGSSKIGKNAILRQKPMQLNIDESPESMNVVLVFETFDLEESHKDE
jgi:hypothetical protein